MGIEGADVDRWRDVLPERLRCTVPPLLRWCRQRTLSRQPRERRAASFWSPRPPTRAEVLPEAPADRGLALEGLPFLCFQKISTKAIP